MIKTISTLLLTVYALSFSQWVVSAEPLANKAIFEDGYPEQAPVETLTMSFESLGLSTFKLDGINNSTRVDFTNRLDKLGKQLTLDFSYTHCV